MRRPRRLLEVSKAHGIVVGVVVNVAALEEGLADEPRASELAGAEEAGGAVVAALLEGEGLGVNVEVLAAEAEADGGRLAAAVVALDAVLRRHLLDAGGLEDAADGARGAEDDGRARVGGHADVVGDDLAVDGHAARHGPVAVGLDAGERAGELLRGDGAVVQLARAVGLEGEAEAAGGELLVGAEGEEERLLAERGAVLAGVTNQAVVGECGRRGRAVNGADDLVIDGEVGTVLRDDVVIDLARGLYEEVFISIALG